MREDKHQTVSQFIDGDLELDEALHFFKTIRQDENLKAKMARYQLIGQTIKNETSIPLRTDFTSKISEQIQREPTLFIPQQKNTAKFDLGKSETKKLLAIAASVMGLAVLVAQYAFNPSASVGVQAVVSANASGTNPLIQPLAKAETGAVNERRPKTAQFNEYLQAHNSSVYINGEPEFHPYAKIVSYGR